MPAISIRRFTDKSGLTHMVRPDGWTECGWIVPARKVWTLRPGDNHEICVTCRKFASGDIGVSVASSR